MTQHNDSLSSRISAAQDQLDRTLGFFSRVDAKASVILAINTSMLAVLTSLAAPFGTLGFRWWLLAAAALPLAASLWFVYKEGFPSLEGGEDSLLYFREVARQNESGYRARWRAEDDEAYLNDLLGQIWRNSVILREKFNHIRYSLIALTLAIPMWLAALAVLASRRP